MIASELLNGGSAAARPRLLNFDSATFARDYDRRPFVVKHQLVGHELFELPALVGLAERQEPNNRALHWSGKLPVNADFDHLFEAAKSVASSAADALERMVEVGAVVVLNHPELDPVYAPLLRSLYEDIRDASGTLDPNMTEVMSYIFVSAPNSVTPYHMDRELNFLLQLRGSKHVHLWDPRDPEVMSEQQVEELFTHPEKPRPAYRPELASKAEIVELTPGIGVHHPFIAPHAVQNGPQISVSLALTYRTVGTERRAATHKANYFLRKIGVPPRGLAASPAADLAKARVYHGLRWLARGAKERYASARRRFGSNAAT